VTPRSLHACSSPDFSGPRSKTLYFTWHGQQHALKAHFCRCTHLKDAADPMPTWLLTTGMLRAAISPWKSLSLAVSKLHTPTAPTRPKSTAAAQQVLCAPVSLCMGHMQGLRVQPVSTFGKALCEHLWAKEGREEVHLPGAGSCSLESFRQLEFVCHSAVLQGRSSTWYRSTFCMPSRARLARSAFTMDSLPSLQSTRTKPHVGKPLLAHAKTHSRDLPGT
jgi:hypothetical protein